jgi:hypothetical protein
MNTNKQILTFFFAVIIITGCSARKEIFPNNCISVPVNSGAFYPLPDAIGGRNRLLIAVQGKDGKESLDDNFEYRKQGAVYYIPATRSALGKPEPFKIRNRDDMPFHPYKMSLITDGKNQLYLFILNYPIKEYAVVEAYSVIKDELNFLYRVRGLEKYKTVGIAALGVNEFIVLNRYSGLGSAVQMSLSRDSMLTLLHYKDGRLLPILTGIRNGTDLAAIEDSYIRNTGLEQRLLISTDIKGNFYSLDYSNGQWKNLMNYDKAPSANYIYPIDGTRVILTDSYNGNARFKKASANQLFSRITYFDYFKNSTIDIAFGKKDKFNGLGRAVIFQQMLIIGREFSDSVYQCSPPSN